MHTDMVLNRMTDHMIVYYPPAFLETYFITKSERKSIELKHFMKKKGIELVALSDQEQKTWGCSFVPIEPGMILNYDISLSQSTIHTLEHEGIRFIHFHPDALLAGGGSLRCLTMSLWRQ